MNVQQTTEVVLPMEFVPTQLDHFLVLAKLDSLEMELLASQYSHVLLIVLNTTPRLTLDQMTDSLSPVVSLL